MGRSRPHLCATIASVPVLLVIGGLSMAQDFDSGPRNRLLLPELSKRSSLEIPSVWRHASNEKPPRVGLRRHGRWMNGLLPMMWSTGTGADVMERIAAPMIGGIASSTMLTLLVIPILNTLWRSWSGPTGTSPLLTRADVSPQAQNGIGVAEWENTWSTMNRTADMLNQQLV